MTVLSQIIRRAERDFPRATIIALRKRGIALIGTTSVPGPGPMPWATSERGYVWNDNGCHRIKTYREVMEWGR